MVVYSQLVVIVIIFAATVTMWKEYSKSSDEFLNEVKIKEEIGQLYENPLRVSRRTDSIDLPEKRSEPATLTSEFNVRSLDNHETDVFWTSLSTEEDQPWDDLRFTVEGGHVESYLRRDSERENGTIWRRYHVKIHLDETVTDSNSYNFSYRYLSYDFDPYDDYYVLPIREQTEKVAVQINLPDGWATKQRIARLLPSSPKYRIPLVRRTPLTQPTASKDQPRQINWSHENLRMGDRYEFSWTAEPIEEVASESTSEVAIM